MIDSSDYQTLWVQTCSQSNLFVWYSRVLQPFQVGGPEREGGKEGMVLWERQAHAWTQAPITCGSGAESAHDAHVNGAMSSCDIQASGATSPYDAHAMQCMHKHACVPAIHSRGPVVAREWAAANPGPLWYRIQDISGLCKRICVFNRFNMLGNLV